MDNQQPPQNHLSQSSLEGTGNEVLVMDVSSSLKRGASDMPVPYQQPKVHVTEILEGTTGMVPPATVVTPLGPPPRFLILHATGVNPLARANPWAIQKGLEGMVGNGTITKPLPSGDLLVQVLNDRQSEILQRTTSLADIPITVTPHQTLNSCRGVVISNDLKHFPEEMLKAGLRDQGVTDVRRIMMRKDGALIPSRVLILTFNTPTRPAKVFIGYLSCSVQEPEPRPLRCFNCQRFGHGKTSCRGTLTCARCAGTGHESEACREPERCVNCGGAHPAYSRSCPKWQEEKEVQTLKTSLKVTYPEARRIIAARTPGAKSYASVVAREMLPMEAQTDMSVPPRDSYTPPAKYLPPHNPARPSPTVSCSTRVVAGAGTKSGKSGKDLPPATSTSKLSKPVKPSNLGSCCSDSDTCCSESGPVDMDLDTARVLARNKISRTKSKTGGGPGSSGQKIKPRSRTKSPP